MIVLELHDGPSGRGAGPAGAVFFFQAHGARLNRRERSGRHQPYIAPEVRVTIQNSYVPGPCIVRSRHDSTLMKIAREPAGTTHATVHFGADDRTARAVAAVLDHKPVSALHVLLIPKQCTGINVDNLMPTDLPLLRMMQAAAAAILAQNGQPASSSYVGFHLPPHTSEDTLHCHVVGTWFYNFALSSTARDRFMRADVFCPIETVIRGLEMLSTGGCNDTRHAAYKAWLRSAPRGAV